MLGTLVHKSHQSLGLSVIITLCNVDNEAGIPVGVHVDHVSNGAVSDGRTEDWDIVLYITMGEEERPLIVRETDMYVLYNGILYSAQ